MTVHVATLARNTMLDAIAALLNGGKIKFYSGAQPANANTALSGNTLLCTLTYGNPAYAAASGGSATANSITSGAIVADGTASFVRIYESDDTTTVLDAGVATSGSDITVPTTTFTTGVTVSMTSNTLSMAA